MRLLTPLFALFAAGCSRSGNFLIEPAPALSQPRQVSSTVKPIFLVPFADGRKDKALHKGRSQYETVIIDTAGTSLLSKAWRPLRPGDLRLLWHRQLAFELDALGFSVSATSEPLSSGEALSRAAAAGFPLVLDGSLKKLHINKRGHDPFAGTNWSGTDYHFISLAKLSLKDSGTGQEALSKEVSHKHTFYNPAHLGTWDRDTFPHYFSRGLPEAAIAVASDPDLRSAAGLPTLTPTPTSTATPEAKPPTPGPTPPPATPAATPTPDPHETFWYCPKDGKKMDPVWQICPFDGTPRSKFILKKGK